jgi:hypothetical protein
MLAAAMLQRRTNVVLAWAGVCTVTGTKTGLGTTPLTTNRHYLESAPLTLVTTFAGMWLQGTIPGYGVEQKLVQNKMRDAALTTLLVIGIATAIGWPPFPSFTVITRSMHLTYKIVRAGVSNSTS